MLRTFCDRHPGVRNLALALFVFLLVALLAMVASGGTELLTWIQDRPISRFLLAIAGGAALILALGILFTLVSNDELPTAHDRGQAAPSSGPSPAIRPEPARAETASEPPSAGAEAVPTPGSEPLKSLCLGAFLVLFAGVLALVATYGAELLVWINVEPLEHFLYALGGGLGLLGTLMVLFRIGCGGDPEQKHVRVRHAAHYPQVDALSEQGRDTGDDALDTSVCARFPWLRGVFLTSFWAGFLAVMGVIVTSGTELLLWFERDPFKHFFVLVAVGSLMLLLLLILFGMACRRCREQADYRYHDPLGHVPSRWLDRLGGRHS